MSKNKNQNRQNEGKPAIMEKLEDRALFSALAAATNVQATAFNATTAFMTWNNNGGATKFRIMHWSNAIGGFVTDGYAGGGDSSYFDSSLSPGGQSVFVVAMNGSAEAWGPTDQTNVYIPVPATSNVRACAVNSTVADITWQNNGWADKFRIMHWSNAINSFVTDGYAAGNATSFRDTGLSPGGQSVYVIAMSSVGEGWGETDTASVYLPVPPATNVTASVQSSTAALITWTNNGWADKFRIMHWSNAVRNFVVDGYAPGYATSFTDTNLLPGTQSVYVVAVSTAGEGWGSSDSATIQIPLPAVTTHINTYAGVTLDGKQCVPAARDLSVAINGKGFPALGTTGVAADLWNLNLSGFTKVPFQFVRVPSAGSLLIWNRTVAKGAGHVALVLGSPSAGVFRVVDSNWGNNELGQIHDISLDSSKIYGWFDPN